MASKINYDSASSAIVNYLTANTATINSGIYSPIGLIGKFVPGEISLWASKFPAISVNLVSTSEVRGSIGPYATTYDNEVSYHFEIGCHLRDIKTYSTTITEMHALAANVAAAIRSDMTISNTFALLTVDGVQFHDTVLLDRKTYAKNCVIQLQCYQYF